MEEMISSLGRQVDQQLRGGLAGLIAPGAGSGPWGETAPCPLAYLGRSLLGVGGPRRRLLGSPRRQREFTPEEQKESAYWSKRRRNNEAARRSRQRRRLEELRLEARALELLQENQRLRAALCALTATSGRPPDCACLGAQSSPPPLPPTEAPRPPNAAPYRPWTDSLPQAGQSPLLPHEAAPRLPHKLRHKERSAPGLREQEGGPGGHPQLCALPAQPSNP